MVPVKRRPTRQALIERGRGRVHVRGRAGRAPGELLRRRVRQRPGRHRGLPGPRRDPEVGQLADPGPVDQHVLRLVVPVHHPAPVRRGQPQQRPLQHHQRRLRRGRPLPGQDLPQRDPLDQLHHDRRPRRRLDVLIQPHHVRIIQRGQHRRLSPEQLGGLRIGQQLTAQVLDRHRGAQGVVAGQHHLAEPARAQHLHLGITRDIPLSRHQVPTHRPPALTLASGRRQSPAQAPARPASGPGATPT